MNSKLHFKELPRDSVGLCSGFLSRPIRRAGNHANIVELTDPMTLWEQRDRKPPTKINKRE